MSAHVLPAPGEVARPAGRIGPVRSALGRLPRWTLICVAVLGTFLALGILGDALGGGPGGPTSSSYATGAQGLAAWAELLSDTGHPVERLRTSLATAPLDPADTLVVLDPEALLHSEGQRLLAFVRAGGRLVFGGVEPRIALLALFTSSPEWSDTSPAGARPAKGAGATTSDVREVRTAGEGQWVSFAGYHAPFHNRDGGAPLLEREIGRGAIELLADASPLQNRLLATADNAQLGLNLAGARGRTVVFVESVHGYGESLGLRALPTRWWLAFAGLTLAGLLWIIGRRRLGPPERAVTDEPPPRSDYTAAIALLLRRTGDEQEIAAALTRLDDRR